MQHDLRRGRIRDNALSAMVTGPLFRARTQAPKKGKGAYRRKHKHRGCAC